MTYTLIVIIALVLLGIVAALLQQHGGDAPDGSGHDDAGGGPYGNCGTCNGERERCEQECMMEAATKPVEYYDDEELDSYAGRSSDAYSDDEAEQFREVLMTLLPTDVKGWNRSLILRGINVPDQLKDELVMLLNSN